MLLTTIMFSNFIYVVTELLIDWFLFDHLKIYFFFFLYFYIYVN